LAQPSFSPDLIAFLQALPEGPKRRGVRYPQWLLLLMAILGILSCCRSARDLERFGRRHDQTFGAAYCSAEAWRLRKPVAMAPRHPAR
jgi:hypothetical protein